MSININHKKIYLTIFTIFLGFVSFSSTIADDITIPNSNSSEKLIIINNNQSTSQKAKAISHILSKHSFITFEEVKLLNIEKNRACTFYGVKGNKVAHGTNVTGYKHDSITCNNSCKSIKQTCMMGDWINDNTNDITTEYLYSSCNTLSGHQLSFETSTSSGNCNNLYKDTDIKIFTTLQENTTFVGICTEYPSNNNSCEEPVKYLTQICTGSASRFGDECKRSCQDSEGNYYKHGSNVKLYNSINCVSNKITCKSIENTCDNGKRKYPDYTSKDCNNSAVLESSGSCTSEYNLTENDILKDSDGIKYSYSQCTGYTVEGSSCKTYNYYKLDSCTLGGKTIRNGESGHWYSSSEAHCDNSCKSIRISRTCTEKGLDGSNEYKYGNCEHIDCLDCTGTNRGTINHGSSVTGYKSESVQCNSINSTCEPGIRTCHDGVLDNPDYNSTNCNLINQCEISDNLILSTTDIINAIKVPVCGSTDTYLTYTANNSTNSCIDSYRWQCKDGYKKNGNSCSQYICSGNINTSRAHYNSNVLPDKDGIQPTYNSNSVGACTYSCNTGYTYASGQGTLGSDCKKDCIYKGNTYHNGSTIQKYNTNKVSGASDSCNNHITTYTCNDGSWKGDFSYKYDTCSEGCSLNGVNLKEGESHIFYKESSPTCPKTCESAIRTCKNGQLEGDSNYTKANCITQTSKANGYCTTQPNTASANISTYSHPISDGAQGCTTQTLYQISSCKNGFIRNGECSCTALKSCTYGSKLIPNGGTGVFYFGDSITCGATNSCSSKNIIKTCYNGVWSGDSNYSSTTCKNIDITCSGYTLTSSELDQNCRYSACTQYMGQSDGTCNKGNTLYKKGICNCVATTYKTGSCTFKVDELNHNDFENVVYTGSDGKICKGQVTCDDGKLSRNITSM